MSCLLAFSIIHEPVMSRYGSLLIFAILFGQILLQENLQHWLTDSKARDQFVIRAGSDTEVLWNDARHLKPDPVYKRTVSGIFFPPILSQYQLSILACFISVFMLAYKMLNCVCSGGQ